jgi:hypothetical protein
MSRLYMMAGAVATGTDAGKDHVSAYVVLADGAKSRLFKVSGQTHAPHIDELTAATTLDLKRFQEVVKTDLEGFGAVRPADKTWACEAVRLHLRCDLGV